MSDDKKNSGEKPLKRKRVNITVNPKDGKWENRHYSRKVKRHLEKEVKEAIEEAAPDGSDAQFDAADKKLDEAKQGVSPDKVDDIEVEVEGTREDDRGRDEQVSRKRKVKPGD